MARVAQVLSGMPPEVPIASINRQCSSGLQVWTTECVCGPGVGLKSKLKQRFDTRSSLAPPPNFSPQAIATIAGQIQLGSIDIGIGAGVESMSMKSMTEVDLKVGLRRTARLAGGGRPRRASRSRVTRK